MPLYIADYLADTTHFTLAEHGAYLHLIMYYWHHGGLPADEKVIARISRMTPHQWKKSYVVLKSKFFDGWHHHRIDIELTQAIEISNKRSASAKQMHSKCCANADTLHTSHSHIESTHTSGTRISSSWKPTEADIQFSVLKGVNDTDTETQRFVDYWRSEHGPKAIKADWSAAWRYWITSASSRNGRNRVNGNGTSSDRHSLTAALDKLDQRLAERRRSDTVDVTIPDDKL